MPGKLVFEVEPIYREIGERIYFVREKRGLTRAELAAQLGWHPTTMFAKEQATVRQSVADLARIADALSVELTVFLADLDVTKCQPPPGQSAYYKEMGKKRSARSRKKNKRS